MFSIRMRFGFDAAKSAANKAKHGIDFVEAQPLWSDPDRIEGPGRSRQLKSFSQIRCTGGKAGPHNEHHGKLPSGAATEAARLETMAL